MSNPFDRSEAASSQLSAPPPTLTFASFVSLSEASLDRTAAVAASWAAGDSTGLVALPQSIGRYAVEGLLGQGAFGVVYLARDEELDRLVAVKVPRRARIATESDVERFLTEARVAARLDHPAIVPVYDFGRTTDGEVYVVSKYIAGATLAERLKQSQPTTIDAAGLVCRVAQALDHAHRQGLVHRDIKPGNLLLDGSGAVYVSDFGLALTLADYEREAHLAGTPAYMSPEQSRGELARLDGRSDVFSLGIVLYELLTGERPFAATQLGELLRQIQTWEPPPAHRRVPRVPVDLSRICRRCLAKRPEERFRTAAELATALERWLQSTATGPASGADVSRLLPARQRPFSAANAAEYLSLLPPPRAGQTVSEPIAFWKSRVEAPGALRVGLLVGACGVGKSSFVAAGLAPSLDGRIRLAAIEAEPGQTTGRLHAALAKQTGGDDLLAAFRAAAQAAAKAGGRLLISIDQFERFFHAPDPRAAALAALLRECDGAIAGAILVVRKEERTLAEGWLRDCLAPAGIETVTWELGPLDSHASRATLVAIGQSLGKYPSDEAELTIPQRGFLDDALAKLSVEGRAAPVRLACLAEAFRDVSWRQAELQSFGGASQALAYVIDNRLQIYDGAVAGKTREAAARIVDRLLPASPGGLPPLVSAGELQSVAGVAHFREIVELLDRELRVVIGCIDSDGTLAYTIADPVAQAALRSWRKRRPGKRPQEVDHRAAQTQNPSSWTARLPRRAVRQRRPPAAALIAGAITLCGSIAAIAFLVNRNAGPDSATFHASISAVDFFAHRGEWLLVGIALAGVFVLGLLIGRHTSHIGRDD